MTRVVHEEIKIGTPEVYEADSPLGRFAVVFEDDGETGYFYALDHESKDRPIQDALLIYAVADVVDRQIPTVLDICWAVDGRKALLLLDQDPHAVFDFDSRRGYSRLAFPTTQADSAWSKSDHGWDESVMSFFARG